jgi:hypothetical protein
VVAQLLAVRFLMVELIQAMVAVTVGNQAVVEAVQGVLVDMRVTAEAALLAPDLAAAAALEIEVLLRAIILALNVLALAVVAEALVYMAKAPMVRVGLALVVVVVVVVAELLVEMRQVVMSVVLLEPLAAVAAVVVFNTAVAVAHFILALVGLVQLEQSVLFGPVTPELSLQPMLALNFLEINNGTLYSHQRRSAV